MCDFGQGLGSDKAVWCVCVCVYFSCNQQEISYVEGVPSVPINQIHSSVEIIFQFGQFQRSGLSCGQLYFLTSFKHIYS